MDNIITSVLNSIESRFYGVFDFITDPFWGWLFLGLIIIAAVIAVTYFFGGVAPWLRWVGGVILMLITFGLYSFRKGEKAQKATDKKREPTPASIPIKWPWQ